MSASRAELLSDSPGEPGEFPLSVTDPAALSRVREVLRAARYTSRGLQDLVGAPASQALLDTLDPAHFLLRRRDEDPLGTLARVFLAAASVEVDVFRRAVAPSSLDDWITLGLVQVEDGRLSGRVQLAASADLVIASDRLGRVFSDDYVMGTGTSTRTLDQLTVRRPSGRTLDLGTGSGILALHAAMHSDQVVAIDKNPRAVQVAKFNVALNERANVTVVEGDLFEPAEGQDFDLVITNPPFIISPESGRIYRDGGLRGDDLARAIVTAAPRFLREGGFAQIICDWSEQRRESWQRRLRGWFAGSGCDVWVLHLAGLDASRYASFQVRGVARPDEGHGELLERYDAWLDYYEREGIQVIHHGVITMRRRSTGENWTRMDDAPEMAGPCGEDVLGGFEARDFLEACPGDQALLEARLGASPRLLCEETRAPGQPGGARTELTLRLASGLLYTAPADPMTMRLMSRLDGSRPLLDALLELARTSGDRVDAVVRELLPQMRDLVQRGFVLPVTARDEKLNRQGAKKS